MEDDECNQSTSRGVHKERGSESECARVRGYACGSHLRAQVCACPRDPDYVMHVMRVMHAEHQNSYFCEAAYATATTNMDDALTEIENLKPGEPFEYTVIAQKHGVDRSLLSRRHRNVTKPYTIKILEQRKLHP